jgi:hypothetical protein
MVEMEMYKDKVIWQIINKIIAIIIILMVLIIIKVLQRVKNNFYQHKRQWKHYKHNLQCLFKKKS